MIIDKFKDDTNQKALIDEDSESNEEEEKDVKEYTILEGEWD